MIRNIIRAWTGAGIITAMGVVIINMIGVLPTDNNKGFLREIWLGLWFGLEGVVMMLSWCFSGVGQLRDCLQSIISEQQALVSQSDALALSSVRLQQQLIVMERYFVALSRHQSADSKAPTRKKQNLQTNLSKQKR